MRVHMHHAHHVLPTAASWGHHAGHESGNKTGCKQHGKKGCEACGTLGLGEGGCRGRVFDKCECEFHR